AEVSAGQTAPGGVGRFGAQAGRTHRPTSANDLAQPGRLLRRPGAACPGRAAAARVDRVLEEEGRGRLLEPRAGTRLPGAEPAGAGQRGRGRARVAGTLGAPPEMGPARLVAVQCPVAPWRLPVVAEKVR